MLSIVEIVLMRKSRASVLPIVALCCLALAFALSGLAATPQSVAAQTNVYHMDEYNSRITVNTDGSLSVVEELKFVYEQGRFRRALREIPLGRVDSITDVSVAEVVGEQEIAYRKSTFNADDEADQGVPGTFGTTTEGRTLRVRWIYQPTTTGSRTFRMSYRANGAVQVFRDMDRLEWYAIPPEWLVPINSSRVDVTLPGGVDASRLETAASDSRATRSTKGNTITWTQNNILSDGLEIGIKIPKGVLQATTPGWQNYRDNIRPLMDVGLLLLGVLIAVLGALWGLLRWYRAGRDKPVKLLSDYITEPPSNLPPGLVGTLLDESADVRDVIATVVDQGRKGNLLIKESDGGGLFSSKDFEYEQTNSEVQYPFEGMVLNAFFKRGNPVRLSSLKNTFYQDLQPIYSEMYTTLVRLKYFPESPATVRSRNRGIGAFFIVLAALIIFATLVFDLTQTVSWMLFAPAMGLVITGIIWILMAGVMPRKTDLGAEESQKWKAFARYLKQMQKYTDVQAATDKFQQYLPYAVALGVERQLINQFNSVPAAMPPYYVPYGWHPIGYYPYPVGSPAGGGEQSVGGGATMPGGGAMPQFDPAGAMQGMSDSFASAMQGMSDSFTSMVNSASSVLTSQPSSSGSSGGGWSGSGGSFGGGGGGGGGGGAD